PSVPDAVRALVAKDPDRAAMQEAGGTFARFALLALIAVGITGAVALLAYLGIRLLLAAVLALLLLLFAPAMLLAPAFGESGRATVRSIVRAGAGPRLAGAAVGRRRNERELARQTAVGALAREELDGAGTRVLTGDHREAGNVLTHRQQLERELRAVDRKLSG